MEKALTDVLNGLMSSIKESQHEKFKTVADNPIIIRAKEAAEEGDIDSFYFTLIYPTQQIFEGLLQAAYPNAKQQVYFLLLNARFVESHFGNLIRKYEGSACSADKSRTILKRILSYYLTGNEITFDWTQQYTYHYPKIIFTNHTDIIDFFEALFDLHYGGSTKYLNTYARITESLSNSS